LATTLTGIVGLLSVLALIISGVMMLTAYGNEDMIGKAKKTATYAIAGFMLALFSFAIISIINSIVL